ncbi:MAG: glutamate--cysteine ligase [Nannocystaceae bacterium]|nr:glutamate--cysteine ligase [Nannocystaceae bacterium]
MEYMIVARDDLAIVSCCDALLREVAGEQVNEVEQGPLCWSNELALHVVELKTNGPVPRIAAAHDAFVAGIAAVNHRLASHGAMLLPTAMHPSMDPATARLWPHDGKPIYNTYDRVFGTSGHGWVNLQSTHLNLPFRGDDEFGRLHAAIRATLPLLPALAASSPVCDGRRQPELDHRLQVYLGNQRRIPSIIGQVVPEPVWTRADYEREILQPMYRDIAPFDPDGELQDEWLNSRGAIARFDRDAIEIRVLDLQEHPGADLAVTDLVAWVVAMLCHEQHVSQAELRALATEPLARLLVEAVRTADATVIEHAPLLRALGVAAPRLSARELWRELAARRHAAADADPRLAAALQPILRHGCLARRIADALGEAPSPAAITEVYRQLASCLERGAAFVPA